MFYQKVEKESLIIIEKKNKEEDIAEFRRRYSFVDWDKTELYLDGFNDEVITRL